MAETKEQVPPTAPTTAAPENTPAPSTPAAEVKPEQPAATGGTQAVPGNLPPPVPQPLDDKKAAEKEAAKKGSCSEQYNIVFEEKDSQNYSPIFTETEQEPEALKDMKKIFELVRELRMIIFEKALTKIKGLIGKNKGNEQSPDKPNEQQTNAAKQSETKKEDTTNKNQVSEQTAPDENLNTVPDKQTGKDENLVEIADETTQESQQASESDAMENTQLQALTPMQEDSVTNPAKDDTGLLSYGETADNYNKSSAKPVEPSPAPEIIPGQ